MSFRGLAQGYDFSTLPKVITHAQLGRVGDLPCSWDPTTWPDCINVFRNGMKELQDAYTKVLQMEVTYQTALQMLNSQPPSEARDEMISLTNQRAMEAAEVRREGIEVANAYEAEVNKWRMIPGVDAIFLNGLPAGRLGLIPVASFPITAGAVFYTVAGVGMFVALAYIVGTLANSWRATENADIAKHNAYGKCLEAYTAAVQAGREPPKCDAPGDTDLTTIMLIAGSAVLAVMLLTTKK